MNQPTNLPSPSAATSWSRRSSAGSPTTNSPPATNSRRSTGCQQTLFGVKQRHHAGGAEIAGGARPRHRLDRSGRRRHHRRGAVRSRLSTRAELPVLSRCERGPEHLRRPPSRWNPNWPPAPVPHLTAADFEALEHSIETWRAHPREQGAGRCVNARRTFTSTTSSPRPIPTVCCASCARSSITCCATW